MAATAILAALTGCEQNGVGYAPHDHDGPGVLGKARLMRDASARIVRVVDVSAAFRSDSTTGAAVLVDGRLGKRLPADDTRHRPVLVRYTTARAARQAVQNAPAGYVLRGSDVLYLPPHFPIKAKDDYRRAMYIGLQ